MSRMDATRADLVTDIADAIGEALVERGIEPTAAQHIGIGVADDVVGGFGGLTLYIPKDHKRRQCERDAEILRRSEHEPVPQLARAFGVSVHAIYRAIRSAKARQSETSTP